MNSLIIITTLFAVSLADDRLFQYCDDDTCEDVQKYTILEYQDLCFEEKLVKFENSLGATHYVGLNHENVASKYVKLCGTADKNATVKSESFFDTKKNYNAQKFFIEFVNDVNDYIYMLVICVQFCLIIRKKICKTTKKLKKALQRSLKKKPIKAVNEYSSVNMPTFFPNLFASRPEINSCAPTISGEISYKPSPAIQVEASAPMEIVTGEVNFNPTSAIQTEASIPMEIVSYYACSCKGPCTTCGCAIRQQQCTKFCHKKNFNENCSRMNN